MKSAKLHNGVVIKFPDDTTDEEIDAAVKDYLGLDEEKAPDAQLAEAIVSLNSISLALQSVTKSVNTMMKGMAEETEKLLSSQAELTKATQENKKIADAIAKGASGVLEGQKKLTNAAVEIIQGLSNLTMEEGKANAIRLAPRVLILNDDGEPVGITVQV